MLQKLSRSLIYVSIFSSLAILFNYIEVYFAIPILLCIIIGMFDESLSIPFDQKLAKDLILEYKDEDEDLRELLKFIDIEFFARFLRMIIFLYDLLLISSLIKFILIYFNI